MCEFLLVGNWFEEDVSVALSSIYCGPSTRLITDMYQLDRLKFISVCATYNYCTKPSKKKVPKCALYSILCTVCYVFPWILIKHTLVKHYPTGRPSDHYAVILLTILLITLQSSYRPCYHPLIICYHPPDH